MPELPEVETIRRQLSRAIRGARIKNVVVRWGKKLEPGKKKFVETVQSRTIKKIERRGKLLRFYLSGGQQMFVHLKMTGGMFLQKKGTEPTKHTHVVFELNGRYDLHWEDFRKFGFIKVLPDDKADEYVASWKFGPEPLARSFTSEKFSECLLRYPGAKIKPKLLDQKCIAGIGNIYAAEALWAAKINPETQIKQVPQAKIKKLYTAVRDVMQRAVKAGGTSADNYFDAYGEEGDFVPQLKVYGREGEPCRRCKTKLKKIKLGGRGTVLCPKCQKN